MLEGSVFSPKLPNQHRHDGLKPTAVTPVHKPKYCWPRLPCYYGRSTWHSLCSQSDLLWQDWRFYFLYDVLTPFTRLMARTPCPTETRRCPAFNHGFDGFSPSCYPRHPSSFLSSESVKYGGPAHWPRLRRPQRIS